MLDQNALDRFDCVIHGDRNHVFLHYGGYSCVHNPHPLFVLINVAKPVLIDAKLPLAFCHFLSLESKAALALGRQKTLPVLIS